MMSKFCLAVDAVSSGCLFIVYVLVLKVTMLAVFLHLSKFRFSSVVDVLKIEARAPTSLECIAHLLV